MTGTLRISRHATDRFRERVDPTLSARQAEAAIVDLARRGKRRPRPRHWLGPAHQIAPGTQYVYAADYPDICLIVSGSVVKTVLTRQTVIRYRNTTHTWKGR